MTDRPHLPHDIGLGLLALAVVGGAAYTLRAPAPVEVQQVRAEVPRELATPRPTVTPTATAVPTAGTTPSASPSSSTDVAAGEPFVLVGPDLDDLDLPAAAAQVSSVEGLAALDVQPGQVVVQVLAGTKTSMRTREAIDAVRQKWPAVAVFVVGPFSSEDTLSTAAVKQASEAAQDVVFLDPVALGWRADARSATLSTDDRAAVALALQAVLEPAA